MLAKYRISKQESDQDQQIVLSSKFQVDRPKIHRNLSFSYYPSFLQSSRQLYQQLLSEIPFEQGKVIVLGKEYLERRLTCGMSDTGQEYYYSGKWMKTVPFSPTVRVIRDLVQNSLDQSILKGQQLNYCLMNHYRDGNDYIGYHADDERAIGPIIASVSIGTHRTFIFKKKKDGDTVFSQDLADGSLVVMLEKCQKWYKHSVPVRKKIKTGRINLTFRILESH